MAEQPRTIRVEIVESQGTLYTSPDPLRLAIGETVVFVPPPGETMHLFMPVHSVFGEWSYRIEGRGEALQVQDLARMPGFELPFAFRYGLYLVGPGVYASGGSSAPKIIIDPPRD